MLQIIVFVLVFIFIFFVVITGVAIKVLSWILRSVKSLFFGNDSHKDNSQPHTSGGQQQRDSKKIFQKDEGEYVDYENV